MSNSSEHAALRCLSRMQASSQLQRRQTRSKPQILSTENELGALLALQRSSEKRTLSCIELKSTAHVDARVSVSGSESPCRNNNVRQNSRLLMQQFVRETQEFKISAKLPGLPYQDTFAGAREYRTAHDKSRSQILKILIDDSSCYATSHQVTPVSFI